MRVFIAIEIPKEIKKQIISQTVELRQSTGRSVRWVPDENIHLTLKFLGEVSLAKIDPLTQMLKSEAAKFRPFEIVVNSLGAFPNLRRPRIVWIGLNAPPALTELQQALEKAAAPLGYLPEKRAFSAHLTIGRTREGLSAAEALTLQRTLENLQVSVAEKFTVDAIHLMQSELKPAGPTYTCLSTVHLNS